MRAYRLYFVDKKGHFVDVRCDAYSSDAGAIEGARSLVGWSTGVEVWERDRFIARVERDERGGKTTERAHSPGFAAAGRAGAYVASATGA